METERQESYSKYFSNNVIASRYEKLFKELIGNDAVSPTELVTIKQEIEDDKKELEEVAQKMLELRILQSALENRIETNEKKVRDTEANPDVAPPDPVRLKSLEDKFKQFSAAAAEYKVK